MLSKLNKLLYEKTYPEKKHAPSKAMLRYAIALACIALLIIVLCATSISRKQNTSGEDSTEGASTLEVAESTVANTESDDE